MVVNRKAARARFIFSIGMPLVELPGAEFLLRFTRVLWGLHDSLIADFDH